MRWIRTSLAAATGFSTFILSWGAAIAGCTLNSGGQVLALAGDTCAVFGAYATTLDNQIAGQASGLNALITGPIEGTISFSTGGASPTRCRRIPAARSR